MPPDQPHPRTHLFLVRLWVEPLENHPDEVRMQVQHILSGETRYFGAWSEVVAFLLAKIQALADEKRREGGDERSAKQ